MDLHQHADASKGACAPALDPKAQRQGSGRVDASDMGALNPFSRFEIDMSTRLSLFKTERAFYQQSLSGWI